MFLKIYLLIFFKKKHKEKTLSNIIDFVRKLLENDP